MTNATGGQGRSDYRWTIFHTDTDGVRHVVETGSGTFGAAEPFTNTTYSSHTAVGAAIFDDACDYLIENHFCEMLDARVEDAPDPVAIHRVTVVVLDADGVERATLTGTPEYRPVTDEDVADHLVGLSRAAIEDERRRFEHGVDRESDPDPFEFFRSDTDPAEDDAQRYEHSEPVERLHDHAAHLRAEVHEPDFCREQLAHAQRELADTEPSADRLILDTRRARVDRWQRLLDISAEAYMDAAALDAAAGHLRRTLSSPADSEL